MPSRSILTIAFCLFASFVSSSVVAEDRSAAPTMAESYPTRTSLAEFFKAKPISFDQLRREVPGDVDVLVWACHSRELPEEARDPKVVAHLRAFVKRGGGLFLVGYAQAYVVDLGLEPTVPNQIEQHALVRESDYSRSRSYFTGLVPKDDHPLFAGLDRTNTEPKGVFLGGGIYTLVFEQCQWAGKPIRNGKNLATYCSLMGNQFKTFEKQQTLNVWTLGRGKVLGYGCNVFLEDFWGHPHMSNLHRFLRNAVSFLSGKENPVIGALPETPSRLHADWVMSPPMHARQQPNNLDRRFPGLPYIAHWGWHGALSYQRAGCEVVDPEYFERRLIDEPAVWGANLLEFYAPHLKPGHYEGYPFEWDEDDPIKRPSDYFGGGWSPDWNNQTSRELFQYAHARDMLVQIFYHPNPVWFRGKVAKDVETKALQQFCEFQSRELQNPLLYGWQASHDGMGTEWWGDSQTGEFVPSIWKYNPGSYRYFTALLPKSGPHVAGAIMCAFGRYASINACGHSDRWRYMFHPPLYLSYQADCRQMKPSSREWGCWSHYGGGSSPDWIIRQVFDFARDRLYLDSSIWWLGESSATLREQDRQYVYGASADPLRCAVTATMRTVGTGGYREGVMGTVDNVPAHYLSGEPYPQDTVFIQNNYFRLLRMAGEDRGILQFDPLRLAFFHKTERPQPSVDLSTDFITAEIDFSPAGPKSDSGSETVVLSLGQIDRSSKEFRGVGNYTKRHVCRGATADHFPAEFRYERWPDWPQEVEIPLNLPVGRYELDMHVCEVDYPAVMDVQLDGEYIGSYFPVPNKPTRMTLPLNLDASGKHVLTIGVSKVLRPGKSDQPGLAHRVDAVRIRRIGTESVYHRRLLPIGHRARLEEVAVKDAAGRYRQRRVYQVDSDWPALRVEVKNDAPVPTAWRTRLALPGYLDVSQTTDREGRPCWIAKSTEPDHPELVFLIDGEAKITCDTDGRGLVITTPKTTKSRFTLAMLLNDGLYPKVREISLGKLLFAPTRKVAISDTPITVKNNLPLARCETIETDATGPYFVAEENAEHQRWWLVRGGQPAGETNYLKLYHQPNSTTRVQRHGFIDGVVKPGYGCQYCLAIRDNLRPNRCEVEVVKTGPFLFAPRIEWKEPFDTVRVNGRPWRYFDGQLICLPNRPGIYTVEVESTGRKAPTLARTFLDVESARWIEEEKILEIDTRVPHWWKGPLAGNMAYVAQLNNDKWIPTQVEGPGELIPWNEFGATDQQRKSMANRGAMLRLYPGKVRVRFESRD